MPSRGGIFPRSCADAGEHRWEPRPGLSNLSCGQSIGRPAIPAPVARSLSTRLQGADSLSMFDQLLDAMRGLSDRSAPDERRRVANAMKEALVHAKMGVQDLRTSVSATEKRVEQEREELATVERRLGLAQQINDLETVAIAERFRAQHADKLAMLETKLMSQQQELTLGERELEEMTVQMRRAMSGLPLNSAPSAEQQAAREVDDALNGDGTMSSADSDPLEAPRLSRAEKEAAAEDRLAELKRRMGK